MWDVGGEMIDKEPGEKRTWKWKLGRHKNLQGLKVLACLAFQYCLGCILLWLYL